MNTIATLLITVLIGGTLVSAAYIAYQAGRLKDLKLFGAACVLIICIASGGTLLVLDTPKEHATVNNIPPAPIKPVQVVKADVKKPEKQPCKKDNIFCGCKECEKKYSKVIKALEKVEKEFKKAEKEMAKVEKKANG